MPRTPKPFNEAARLTLADGAPVSSAAIESLIERQEKYGAPRLANLWAYYRNPMDSCPAAQSGVGGRGYRLAQERGLPPRILGAWDRRAPAARFAGDDRAWQRKEVVVENDIAWRIQTMVDFMFGRPLKIASTATDPALRETIERALAAVWDVSGGIALMQDMGLLGHVYGHVDLLIRALGDGGIAQDATPRGGGGAGFDCRACRLSGARRGDRAAPRRRPGERARLSRDRRVRDPHAAREPRG